MVKIRLVSFYSAGHMIIRNLWSIGITVRNKGGGCVHADILAGIQSLIQSAKLIFPCIYLLTFCKTNFICELASQTIDRYPYDVYECIKVKNNTRLCLKLIR